MRLFLALCCGIDGKQEVAAGTVYDSMGPLGQTTRKRLPQMMWGFSEDVTVTVFSIKLEDVFF